MPFVEKKTFATCDVFIWKIEESEENLSKIRISEEHLQRLSRLTSQKKRLEFWCVRHLLQIAGYSDQELYYNSEGKPFLKNGYSISISHSDAYVVIALSDHSLGVDIEKPQEKILRVYPKFIDTEKAFVENKLEYLVPLTVIWSAKESVYKALGEKGLPLKKINILPFTLEGISTQAMVDLEKREMALFFTIYYQMFDDYVLTLAVNT